MTERTLFIIKPNVTKKNKIGEVIAAIEAKGFRIVEMKMEKWDDARAAGFYEVHKGKPFYGALVEFMTSGMVVPMVLESENCVESLRQAIGATDPAKAEEGTVRKRFGDSLTRNAVHASDSLENAAREIAYVFGC